MSVFPGAVHNVAALGEDLPVIIGEYHFGALDWDQTATGVEALETQAAPAEQMPRSIPMIAY